MKKTILKLSVVSVLTLAAVASVRTQCANSYTEAGTGFTFCPPAGWTSRKDAADIYSTFYAPRQPDGSTPNINIKQEAAKLSLDEYVIATMKNIFKDPEIKQGLLKIAASDVTDFKTTSGISGVRMTYQYEFKGSAVRSLQYIFDRGGTMKFLLTGTFPEANPGFAEVIESAARTVRITN